VSDGIVARLRSPLAARLDLSEALPAGWTSLGADELTRRAISADARGAVLGDLFELTGGPSGRIRFTGDLARADRIAAGLTEGQVEVDGDAGDEAGLAMRGGALLVRGSAGARLGGAAAEARRGMTGGEIVVLGDAGPEAGARMRRGLIAIGGRSGTHAGVGMIAGTLVLAGPAGAAPGLWSKRGSIVALGPIDIPPTYRLACTYQPVHLRLTLSWLRGRFGLRVDERHLSGSYRRYSGDLADLGKGEILEWTAS
jgi:formylmethanofuran dehydrogenase subunit C